MRIPAYYINTETQADFRERRWSRHSRYDIEFNNPHPLWQDAGWMWAGLGFLRISPENGSLWGYSDGGGGPEWSEMSLMVIAAHWCGSIIIRGQTLELTPWNTSHATTKLEWDFHIINNAPLMGPIFQDKFTTWVHRATPVPTSKASIPSFNML